MNISSYTSQRFLYPHVYGTFLVEVLNHSYDINREIIQWVFQSWFKNILDSALSDSLLAMVLVDQIPDEYEHLIWLDIMIDVSITSETVGHCSLKLSGRCREDDAFASISERALSELFIGDDLSLGGYSDDIEQQMKDSLLELLASNQGIIEDWLCVNLKDLKI